MPNTKLFTSDIEVTFCDAAFNLFEFDACVNADKPNPVYHKHAYYEVHLGVGRDCVFTSQHCELSLKRGTLIIIPPGEYHYTLPHDQMTEMLVLKLTISKIDHHEHIYDHIIRRLNEVTLSLLPASHALMRSATGLMQIQIKTPQDACRAKIAAYQMVYDFLETLRIFDEPVQSDTCRNKSGMDLVVLEELVNTGNYTLNEIAALLGYSEKQTYRMILKIYGMPFRELRKHRMLEHTKKLLTDDPDLPVAEAARIVGFKTTSAFYKAFREVEGCTPAKYKEKVNKGAKQNE